MIPFYFYCFSICLFFARTILFYLSQKKKKKKKSPQNNNVPPTNLFVFPLFILINTLFSPIILPSFYYCSRSSVPRVYNIYCLSLPQFNCRFLVVK